VKAKTALEEKEKDPDLNPEDLVLPLIINTINIFIINGIT